MTMTCVNCGRDLYEDRCKVRCPNCGYFEDCSDPGAPGDWSRAEERGDAPGGGGGAGGPASEGRTA